MRNPGAEWGYSGLGREPGRAASLIFVACAVGAIAGAGAVFSLVVQPESETSIGAAHPLGSAVARAAAHSSVKEAAPPSRPRLASTLSVSQEQLPSHVDNRWGRLRHRRTHCSATRAFRNHTARPCCQGPWSSRPKSVPH
jgi:hypothetical protein